MGVDGRAQGRGEREERKNGGGVLRNGNGQYLQHGSRRGEFVVMCPTVIVEKSAILTGMETRRMVGTYNLMDPSACYHLRGGFRGEQLPPPSPYPTAISLSTGVQEHLMMTPVNHVGERTLETAAVEKFDTDSNLASILNHDVLIQDL